MARQLAEEGRLRVERGEFSVGCTTLLQAILQDPILLEEYEADLAMALDQFSRGLVESGKLSQGLWLYNNTLHALPRAKIIWHDLGSLNYQLQNYKEAMQAFEAALKVDPYYLPAVDALENIRNLAIDRWHFRMLNDRERNLKYHSAIQAAIRAMTEKKTGAAPVVLDIGTGTGLLSMMAVQAGAGHVYAVETNTVLSSIAKDIILAHGMADKITVINRSSYDLLVAPPHLSTSGLPDFVLPQRVDVVVTELVDSGLLGEHILGVLRHAEKNLLKPGGMMVPYKATVYATCIESVDIRRRYKVGPHTSSLVGRGTVVDFLVDESYTSESLNKLKHQKLTRPTKVLELLMSMDEGVKVESTTELEVIKAGQVDALAIWYDLELVASQGPDESYSFTTSPIRADCAWDQGIYFLKQSEGFTINEVCSKISLFTSVVDDQLEFSLNRIEHPEDLQEEQANVAGGNTNVCPQIFRVGEMDIAQMNDKHRLDLYHEAIYLAVASGYTNVLELGGIFSLLGLVAERAGARALTLCTESPESRHALNLILKQNSSTCPASVHPLPNRQSAHHTGKEINTLRSITNHNLLLTDLVEGSGLLRQGILNDVLLMKEFVLEGEKESGETAGGSSIIPYSFTVVVQLIESMELARQNRVFAENTLGFNLCSINDYGVRKFREINLSELDYTPLSSPVEALHVCLQRDLMLDMGGSTQRDLIAKNTLHLRTSSRGRLQAVAFWFKLQLNDPRWEGGSAPIVLCMGPSETLRDDGMIVEGQEDSALSSLSHWRQGAVLLPPGEERGWGVLEKDRTIELSVLCSLSRGVDILVT